MYRREVDMSFLHGLQDGKSAAAVDDGEEEADGGRTDGGVGVIQVAERARQVELAGKSEKQLQLCISDAPLFCGAVIAICLEFTEGTLFFTFFTFFTSILYSASWYLFPPAPKTLINSCSEELQVRQVPIHVPAGT